MLKEFLVPLKEVKINPCALEERVKGKILKFYLFYFNFKKPFIQCFMASWLLVEQLNTGWF